MKRILAVLALALSAIATGAPVVHTQSPGGAAYVPGEILIQFQPDATPDQQAEARVWAGAARRELLRRKRANRSGDLELARVPGRAVEQAVALLRRHPAVRLAEPNWIYRRVDTSNDPHYVSGLLWGMLGDATTGHVNQFGSQAGEAWEAGHTGSASVAVGIIDEGIQIDHPDLAANIWTNPVEAAGLPGVDDDDNGYVDDIHGWDFLNNDNSVFDGTGDDHGTHVAGTIGAAGGNGIGVAGVNWNVTLVPAKFLGPSGGTTAAAIKAIDYITDLKTRHHLNVVATNNSWGGGGFSQALLNAIVRGANENILFVAAAGNDGGDNDAAPNYPSNYETTAGAGYDAVIAVASITSTGAKSGFSAYGATTVDLGAPGSSIVSTVPGSTYANFSGTSMAAPHVTGAAALYASVLPAVSARRIKEVILASATATPTPSLAGETVTGGRLNIGEFAGPAPAPPTAPGNLTATASSTSQIDLTWADTSSNEDGFQIERCQGAACTAFAVVAYVDEGVVSYNDIGLSPTTLYRYRVSAFNPGGASPYAPAEAATLSPPLPHAHAGADVSVNEEQAVTLDGTQSSYAGSGTIAFAWTQSAGTVVALTGADTSQPTFTSPAVGPGGATLTFTLTVTADGSSATDTVDVTVLNVNAPPAIASVAPLTATEDVPYSYAAAASDEDGPGQTWRLLPAHTCGGTVTAATGLFTFTPAGPVPPASCVLALQVCDGGDPNLCGTQTVAVAIVAVNDLPAFVPPADITTAATSASGATVSFTATGSDPEDGPLTAVCTPASDSVFAVGLTSVHCEVTDSAGAKAAGAFTVTVTQASVPGDMSGDGFIRDDDAKYSFSFAARERASGFERARLSVRIDEDGRRRKNRRRDDRFESRSVDVMVFSDDPTIRPGRRARPQIDTVLFKGVGEWNGRNGYRYEVFAQDAGEPGRHRESIRVTIWAPTGAVVAAFEGTLDGGNIRSRLPH